MNDSVNFPATGMPDDDWWQALWPDPQETLAISGIEPGMSVIDLCCGNGHFTVPLAFLLGQGGSIIGVDLDQAMLDVAQDRMERAADGRPSAPCQWMAADACTIDQQLQGKDQADALVIANTFHGVPNQTALSASVARVLKPGGLFIIINWHARPRADSIVLGQPRGPKDDTRMSPQDVAGVVIAGGFTPGPVIDLPPCHYAAVFNVAPGVTTA